MLLYKTHKEEIAPSGISRSIWLPKTCQHPRTCKVYGTRMVTRQLHFYVEFYPVPFMPKQLSKSFTGIYLLIRIFPEKSKCLLADSIHFFQKTLYHLKMTSRSPAHSDGPNTILKA